MIQRFASLLRCLNRYIQVLDYRALARVPIFFEGPRPKIRDQRAFFGVLLECCRAARFS
jgi:hypothetical protein